MKITQKQLKRLIKEEVSRLIETKDIEGLKGGKVSLSQVRSGAVAQAGAQTGGSFTDEERNLLKELVELLTLGAQKTDLLQGMPATSITRLVAVLRRVIGEPEEEGTPDTGVSPDTGDTGDTTATGVSTDNPGALEEQLVEKIVQSLSQRSR